MNKNPHNITDLNARRANNAMIYKLVNAQRAVSNLDANGHKVLAVNFDSDLPLITIDTPTDAPFQEATQMGCYEQTVIKFTGAPIAHVIWRIGASA